MSDTKPRDAVEVGGKYYRPKVQTFMYDKRGRLLASRSQAAGSGLRAYANYKFPGGGIEPNEDVIAAARKELLEEAGYEPGGEMFEFGTRTPVDWDDKFREQVARKGRGAYHGQYEYYVGGPIGKRNRSHFGSEGDQMTGLSFVSRKRLREALRATAHDPDNEYGYFDKQKLVALAELERALKERRRAGRVKHAAAVPKLTTLDLAQRQRANLLNKPTPAVFYNALEKSAVDLTTLRDVWQRVVPPNAIKMSYGLRKYVARQEKEQTEPLLHPMILAPPQAGATFDMKRYRDDYKESPGMLRLVNPKLEAVQQRLINHPADILIGRGGDAVKALGKVAPMPLPNIDGSAKEVVNRLVDLHEISERSMQKSYPGMFPNFESHLGPQPMLNDMNITNTYTGPGADGVRQYMRTLRQGELDNLKSAVPQHAEAIDRLQAGERISRHARRRIEIDYMRQALAGRPPQPLTKTERVDAFNTRRQQSMADHTARLAAQNQIWQSLTPELRQQWRQHPKDARDAIVQHHIDAAAHGRSPSNFFKLYSAKSGTSVWPPSKDTTLKSDV